MPVEIKTSETLVLTLESSHLKKLFEEGNQLEICYDGYHKLKINIYKPVEGITFSEKRKITCSYNELKREFVIFLDEDDIPTNAMNPLKLNLPKTSQKIKTLVITCPFQYKR